ESPEQVVQSLDAVHDWNVARVVESDLDDVALRGRDDDALDPLFPLEVAGVAADQLHLRAGKGDVEGSRARSVRQEKTHDLAVPNSRARAHLTIHEEHVPEPAHEGVRCLLAPKWDELPVVADEEIVENECFHMIRCREVVTARRPHHQIPIEAEVLLDVLADVGVVPVDPRIREVQVVREGPTGSHGPLREVRYAIESVVEPNPVPMNRG